MAKEKTVIRKRNPIWKIGKSIGLGFLFWFVSYLLTGQNELSLALGLLVIYMESRLRN